MEHSMLNSSDATNFLFSGYLLMLSSSDASLFLFGIYLTRDFLKSI